MNKKEFAILVKDYCGDAVSHYCIGVSFIDIHVVLFHVDRIGGGVILHKTRSTDPRWKRHGRAVKHRIKFQRWLDEIRAGKDTKKEKD